MAYVTGIVAEKGGVGKSTICFNLAYELSRHKKKVLIIDMDGQRANLTFIADIEKSENLLTMYDVLVKNTDILHAVRAVDDNLHLVPAMQPVTLIHQDNSPIDRMKEAIEKVRPYYDYIFIDVSPTPGRSHALTLATADYVLIPMLPDIASLEANLGVIGTIKAAQANGNPDLQVLGIVFNKYSWRSNLSRSVTITAEKMAENLNTKVFDTKLRNIVATSEAVGKHIDVVSYDAKSKSAQDIISLTKEFEKEIKKHGKKG